MRGRRLAPFAGAAVALACLVAGCGGSSSSDADEGGAGGAEISTSSLSKAAYVKAADARCKKKRENLAKLASTYLNQRLASGASHDVALAELGRRVVVPSVQGEMDVLRQLGAPAGDEEEIEGFFAAEEKAVAEVKKMKEAKEPFQLIHPFFRLGKMLEAYGIDQCANFL